MTSSSTYLKVRKISRPNQALGMNGSERKRWHVSGPDGGFGVGWEESSVSLHIPKKKNQSKAWYSSYIASIGHVLRYPHWYLGYHHLLQILLVASIISEGLQYIYSTFATFFGSFSISSCAFRLLVGLRVRPQCLRRVFQIQASLGSWRT